MKAIIGGIITALALILAAAPRAAAREAPEAIERDAYIRDVVGRAAAHVEAGRFDQALAVLDEGERERPYTAFLYARGAIEELRGDCARAAELYRRFLEHDVPAADAEEARKGEARCRAALGMPQIATQPEPVPEADTVESPAKPEPRARRWYQDPAGAALVATGVVGLGVGLGLYVQGRADERGAARAEDLQAFDDHALRAIRLNQAAIATLAVASGLAVAGVIRYAVLGRRDRRRRTRMAAGSVLSVRF